MRKIIHIILFLFFIITNHAQIKNVNLILKNGDTLNLRGQVLERSFKYKKGRNKKRIDASEINYVITTNTNKQKEIYRGLKIKG